MGGKKGSGSLFYEPNRQFFPDGSHFRIFNEISLPAGLRLPPVHGALCFLIPLTCLPHRFPVNPLTPNDPYRSRTAPLTSKRCILYIYSTNTITEYFKHGINSPFFPLQNAVCFIILPYLIPVFFTFYIQGVLKLKK